MPTPEQHATHDAEAKEAILANIEKYDCHIALLSPTKYLPGFAYTIGLYKQLGSPEIICFGLHPDVLGAVLNHARDLIKEGEVLTPGKSYPGFLQGYDIQFIVVDKAFYPNYVGYGGWFYDRTFDFPLYQLVWPDKQHLFPWQEGFNPDWKHKQPLLDRNTDFKFYEERNLGVYTTRQAFAGNPILYVYHNSDGDWQFHTSDKPKIEDAMLVCLEELTKLDPSLNEICHLDYGERAWRSSPEEDWQWEEDEKDASE
ncbi:MAG: DUF4262 domain-containing protein [Bacteroidetes bacterium]|nr:DUF4262 domain-containing protein [Bacteroidota bacterium]